MATDNCLPVLEPDERLAHEGNRPIRSDADDRNGDDWITRLREAARVLGRGERDRQGDRHREPRQRHRYVWVLLQQAMTWQVGSPSVGELRQ